MRVDRPRVAVWGTGDVGHYVLRGVISHPDLDLVGLRVWNEKKAGRDAGELIGWDPIGVSATTSTAEILTLQPDCLVHTAPSRVLEPVADFLEAGINVVTLGDAGLVHPPTWEHPDRARVLAACEAGKSSLFYGGIDAGFCSHTLPIVLTAICERIDLMTIYEVRDYDPLPRHQLDWFNFGKPTKEGARFDRAGGISHVWSPSLRLIADALGVSFDRIEEFFEVRTTDEAFDIPAMHIAAGTIAAARFGLSGILDGAERIRLEHVNRLRRDLAPDWQVEQGYGVVVKGAPDYRLHLDLWDPAGVQSRPALWGTAMYCVNAVPHVVAAAPGAKSVLDLPYITGRRVGGRAQLDNWTLSERIKDGAGRSE
jgi:4-hydroxy-tetrahydrodipicolinate reductase